MENGRPDRQAEAAGPHNPGPAPVKNEIIRCEVNGATQHAARQFGRGTATDGTAARVLKTCNHLNDASQRRSNLIAAVRGDAVKRDESSRLSG
jgi:hypothetical protein